MNVLFIDSGIGGITTLATVIKRNPNLNFIYYGDDKFSPYGSLEPSQIITRLSKIIGSQKKHHIGLVVLACNTATAVGIDYLRKVYHFPIVGTEPAIKPVSKQNNRILVLATPATTANKRFNNLVVACPCSLEVSPMRALAKQIDNYFLFGDYFSKDEIDITINQINRQAKDKTHIVLGCTHYVHLKRLIQSRTGKIVVDGNFGVCKQVEKNLTPLFFSKRPKQKFIVSTKNKNLCKKYRKIFLQTLANIDNV